MPLFLLLVGIVLVITAAQDTYVDFGRQMRSDIGPGKGSFLWYGVALIMAGVLGYVEKLRPVSIGFMSLVLLVMFLKDNKFFTQLMSELSAKPIAPNASAPSSVSSGPNVGNTTSASSAADFNTLEQWGTKLGESFGFPLMGP